MLPLELDRHSSGGIAGRTVLFGSPSRAMSFPAHALATGRNCRVSDILLGFLQLRRSADASVLPRFHVAGRCRDAPRFGPSLAGVADPPPKLPQPCTVSPTCSEARRYRLGDRQTQRLYCCGIICGWAATRFAAKRSGPMTLGSALSRPMRSSHPEPHHLMGGPCRR
jgi:hypothetical protein